MRWRAKAEPEPACAVWYGDYHRSNLKRRWSLHLCDQLPPNIYSSAPSLSTISMQAALWAPEQRFIYLLFSKNPAIIYNSSFCVYHKRKSLNLKSNFNVNWNLIYGRHGIFMAMLFVFGDKNSLFMKNTILTQIPLFPLQHIH